jgi:hypothetical protein
VIRAADGIQCRDGTPLQTCVLRPAAIYGPGEARHFPRIVPGAPPGRQTDKTAPAAGGAGPLPRHTWRPVSSPASGWGQQRRGWTGCTRTTWHKPAAGPSSGCTAAARDLHNPNPKKRRGPESLSHWGTVGHSIQYHIMVQRQKPMITPEMNIGLGPMDVQ